MVTELAFYNIKGEMEAARAFFQCHALAATSSPSSNLAFEPRF